ncbi:MAG: LysR family transcriptional regulator [Pseudomonadota bacterium]
MHIDWDLYRVFRIVAQRKSLTASTEELKMSSASIARRIAQLEEILDARLFDRNQDGYFITPAGLEVLPFAEELAKIANAIERNKPMLSASGAKEVRIAAGYWITEFLLREMPSFHRDHPEISVEIVSGYEFANLERRDADLAIRNRRPDVGRLAVRKLSEFQYAVYGRKDYVEANPDSLTEKRFQTCDWIALEENQTRLPSANWLYARLETRPIIQCSYGFHILQGVKSGLGLGVLPRFAGDNDDTLTRVSESLDIADNFLWLVIHEDLRKAIAARAFADWLVALFKENRTQLAPSGDS